MPVSSYRLLFSFLLSINYGSALAQPCFTPTISGIQTLCVGDTLTITAEPGFESYMWSNGTNGAATDIFAPGTYQLTVTCINGQTNVSDVTISAFSTGVFGQINLGAPICEGECNVLLLKTFNSDNDPFTFTWELSTGGTYSGTVIDQANDIVLMEVCPSETTTYTLLSFINSVGCEAFLDPSWLSTTVTVIPDEPATISGPSYTCSNQPAILTALPDGQAYNWSNGSNNQQITVTQPGTYTVTVTSGGLTLDQFPPQKVLRDVSVQNPWVIAPPCSFVLASLVTRAQNDTSHFLAKYREKWAGTGKGHPSVPWFAGCHTFENDAQSRGGFPDVGFPNPV